MKENKNNVVDENNVVNAVNAEVLAHIVLREDGYHVIDLKSGEEGPVCKLVDEGEKTIALTPNSSNRKWANRAKADASIADIGYFPLYYKASKQFGPSSTRIPNEKLLVYLTEEEQAEYKAIFAEARERMLAERNKPIDPVEKLRKQIEAAQAKLAKLEAECVEGGNN